MHDSKDYESRKKQIVNHFKKNGVTRAGISEYCMFSFVPITVTCEFIMDEMPEHKELCEVIIHEINAFYGGKN
jgi:hypothetical protein